MQPTFTCPVGKFLAVDANREATFKSSGGGINIPQQNGNIENIPQLHYKSFSILQTVFYLMLGGGGVFAWHAACL